VKKHKFTERKKKGGAAPRRISSAIAFVPADKERPRISQNKIHRKQGQAGRNQSEKSKNKREGKRKELSRRIFHHVFIFRSSSPQVSFSSSPLAFQF
jgi:hypothetical protein